MVKNVTVMFESLRELGQYRSMVRNLVKREVRGRYKGSVLGFFWNFILPLIQILVYIMVFTQIFRSDLDNYAVYLVSGMVFWIWFSDSISEGSGTIVANSDMVKKIYFPRVILPVTITLSKMVNFIITLGIFFVIIAVLDHGFDPMALLFLPLIIVISLFFIVGFSILLSAINVYLRDTQYITTVILMAWVWLTPIMYSRDFIESTFINQFLSLNPMTYFVSVFQDILYWKAVPDMFDLGMCALLALVMMVVGTAVFRYLERDFAEVL